MTPTAKIEAKAAVPTHYCDKCGRKFVYANPNCKVDTWPTKADPKNPCGGNVLPLPTEPKETRP